MGRFTYKNSFKPRSIRKSESKAQRKLIFNLVLVVVLIFVFFNWGLPSIIGSLSFLNKNNTKTPKAVVKVDEAIAPPVLYIPFESTNSATLTISGYSSPLSKIEVYIDDELKAESQSDSEGRFITNNLTLNLGINNIQALTVNDKNLKSLPSKNIKIFYSNENPTLEITEPSDQLEIKGSDKRIKVSGKTDPANSVTINGSTTIVNSDGIFETFINLNEGENIVTVVSINGVGNKNQLQRIVRYTNPDQSPQASPTP